MPSKRRKKARVADKVIVGQIPAKIANRMKMVEDMARQREEYLAAGNAAGLFVLAEKYRRLGAKNLPNEIKAEARRISIA